MCPVCHEDLILEGQGLHCSGCARTYPLIDGIPRLAIFGEAGNFSLQSEAGQTYEYKFTTGDRPEGYDRQFIDEPHKRTRTRREIAILNRLLARAGRSETLLNIPSGGGRLSQPLAEATTTLVEADVAAGQVAFAKDHGDYGSCRAVAWLTASAFHLPFPDRSFEGVLCARLIHHFSAPADHARLLAELCRVAERFVIISFNDAVSTKAISRRLRGKENRHTLTCRQLDDLAAPHGLKLQQAPSVSLLGSRHRFALLMR